MSEKPVLASRQSTFHPATPMKPGIPKSFRIGRQKFASSGTRRVCTLTEKTFTVQKQFVNGMDRGDEVQFSYFYTISGSTQFNELQISNETHRYHNQVAYIRCTHGWISQLQVFDSSDRQ